MLGTIKKICFSLIALLVLTVSMLFVFSFEALAEGAGQPNALANGISSVSDNFKPKMSITLHSNLVVNVYIPKESTQSFTFDGDLYENLDNSDNIFHIDGKLYYRASRELSSSEAARDLPLTVYAEINGISAVGKFTFSIPKYAKAILSSNSTAVERTLVKDTLAYIASSYSYFETDDADTVCEGISEIIGDYSGSYAIRSRDVTNTAGFKGATFVLGAEPSLRFYLEDGSDKSSYSFFSNNKQIYDIEEGVDENGGFLSLSLYAYKMCGAVDYAVDGAYAGSYGIHNYYSYVSKSAYTDTKKEELRSLLRKFYNYTMSAANYYVSFYSDCDADKTADLTEYTVVYPVEADVDIIERSEKLALSIKAACGYLPDVVADTEAKVNAKKLFVGYSDLIPTHTAVKLFSNDSADAFILDFCNEAITVFGKSENSSQRAVEYFIENYVNSSYQGIISLPKDGFEVKPYIALDNGSEIVVETVSTVFEVVSGIYNGGLYPSSLSKSYYPSVIELKHNGANNGKLIAILAVNDTPTTPYKALDTNSCVMESSDGGLTWKMIARPRETINPTYTDGDGKEYSIQGISMAHIYELPAAVGDMPAGTLLYSGTSVNYDCYSQVAIWRSFDCGYTWEEFTVIASGGGLREGVWEPFTFYEKSDGYLYCFYSDDSDPAHDQKIVYKRSKDGVNWSDAVEVCAFAKVKDRPGMIIMTEMGSGEYFMVYEYYGTYGGKVLCKITDDISSWNPSNAGNLLKAPDGYTVGGGPACVWTSSGGENGILIASGKNDTDGGQRHLLFVSFDYGRSFTTIENPLPYDITLDSKATNRIGHSPVFIVGSDPSVIYYLNTTVNATTGYQRVEFAKLRIYQ